MSRVNLICKFFVLVACFFALNAQAKQVKKFGVNAPFTLAQLPPSKLTGQIKSLPSAAQSRALGWLNEIHFSEQDIPYMRVDREGAVLFVDPIFENTEVTIQASATDAAVRNVTFAQAFSLHSKKGAANKVYLDLDGHTITGTAWNNASGVKTLYARPYDTDKNESVFSQSELNDIAEIWKRVAEDFAAYDVDITTEQPAALGPKVGHILITPQRDQNGNSIFNCGCGGVAYLNVWGRSNYRSYQPALVFSSALSGAHYIAEAASHELGHNLSLAHDGNASTGYYTGHGTGYTDWAPIMGVGYYAHLTQWSRGEYANANNQQDDLQLMANRLSYRKDDHANNNRELATALVVTNNTKVEVTNPVSDPANANKSNKGIIETRSDIDLFYVDVGDGVINLTVTPAWIDSFSGSSRRGMNLDVKASLYNDAGLTKPIAQNNPDKETDATINMQVPAGRYYLAVTGVGRGNPLADGYTDYASIGQYHINGTIVPPEDKDNDGQNPWQENQSGFISTNINWNYAMGYHFMPEVNGSVTQLGGIFNGTRTVKLFDRSSGALLAQTQVTAANDWGYSAISPVSVKAGRSYTVAVYLAGAGGTYQSNAGYAFPQTYGDIKIQATTYISTLSNPSARPTNSMLHFMVGQADITFLPDVTEPDPGVMPLQDNQTGVITPNINWNHAMGYHFVPQVDGSVTQLGGIFNGTKLVKLFDRTSGALLAQTQVTAANDWGYSAISPVVLKAGQSYTVAVYLAGSGGVYLVNDGGFNWPQTFGDIKIQATTYISTLSNASARPVNSLSDLMLGQADISFLAK